MDKTTIPLDAFDLAEEIGSGASGRVWSATHRESGDFGPQIAIKILSGKLARNERWVAAFRREVQAIASLDHPNIVRVYDHGQVPALSPFDPSEGIEPGSPYLAMEYLGGGTLTSRAGRLHWADLQAVLLTMLDALAHAHARNVLHRDIKPSNLLIGPSGVAITDFGLGFTLAADNPDTDRMLGTPAYMAPEQFQCHWRDFGPWTDLYALGCTAYALASARPPFGARQSLEESMHGHLFAPPPPLEARMETPAGFEAWIRRLMRKSPANRFRCAADAAWALSSLKLPRHSPDALRPASSELSALGFSTLDLPSEVPTDLLSAYTFAVKTTPVPSEEDEEGLPNFAPPCPDHWRRSKDSASNPQLGGVGLGLFGLRSIPLVGRDEVRTELWSALREVHRSGKAQIRVLRGPGGTGKSRLAQWISERAHEAGAAHRLSAMHSANLGSGDGLAPMIARQLGCSNLSHGESVGQIGRLVDSEFTLSVEEVEGLADFLRPPSDQERTLGYEGTRFQSPVERNTVMERVLRRETRDRPLVFWLDDVHWGLDSLFFVLHLLANQAESPLRSLIVLTVRDDLLPERPVESELLEQILQLDGVRELFIGPLEPADRPALIRELLGLKGELAQRVEERSAGNPLFAVQLVGDWVQRGILVPSPSGFEVSPGASLRLPDTIHDIWKGRIDRLLEERPPSDQSALELAAMLGHRINWGEWRLVCKEHGTRASIDLVDELVGRRLAEIPSQQTTEQGWAFVHGMLRESIKRRSWEAGRARDQHRSCARLLKSRFGGDASARHAHHLLAAGDLHEAIVALGRSAGSFVESGEQRRAGEMLDERDRALDELAETAKPEDRIEGVLLRSFVARAGKSLDLSIRLAKEAEQLARQANSARFIARAIRAQGTGLGEMGLLKESEAALRRAGELAKEVGDLHCLAASKRGQGACLTQLGDAVGAGTQLQEALDLYRGLGEGYGVTVCLIGLSRQSILVQNYDRAASLAAEALDSARRLGFRSLVVDSVNQRGEAARGLGQFDVAEQSYKEAIRLARKLPSYVWVGIFEINLGLLLAQQERWEEALQCYRDGELSLRRTSGNIQAAFAAFFATTCLAGLGRWKEWEELFNRVTIELRRYHATEPDLALAAQRSAEFALAADKAPLARQAITVAIEQWTSLGDDVQTKAAHRFLAAIPSA